MSAMSPQTAEWLVTEGRPVMEHAATLGDPDALATATALRRELPPERAAAVLTQLSLRRRARTKLGDTADGLWLTSEGLQQATRPVVARWRAEQLASTGVEAVVDLGCGLGLDARALRTAGIAVRAVERDPVTAILAEANLGMPVECTEAESVRLAPEETAFCDPARRTSSGRVWRVQDFSPGWDFVTALLQRPAGACIKLGPGLPHRLIPAGVRARWISHSREVVEVSLWGSSTGPSELSDRRSAVLLSTDDHDLPRAVELVADDRDVPVGEVTELLAEPDPALIRSGGVGTLAAELGLTRLEPGLAYLGGSTTQVDQTRAQDNPWLTWFEVLEILPCKEKALRAWVREHRIGTLEIKKRGVDLDPAQLRRTLRPRGPESATLVLTPTPQGARALVVRRLSPNG